MHTYYLGMHTLLFHNHECFTTVLIEEDTEIWKEIIILTKLQKLPSKMNASFFCSLPPQVMRAIASQQETQEREVHGNNVDIGILYIN
jgi:hypothetical protein